MARMGQKLTRSFAALDDFLTDSSLTLRIKRLQAKAGGDVATATESSSLVNAQVN